MFQKPFKAMAPASRANGRRLERAAVSALAALVLSSATSAAATLQVFDFTFPVAVNAVAVGDFGSQSVAPTGTYLPGYGYLLNQYYLSASAPEYFNYNITYAPLTSAFASTRVWTGLLDAATGATSSGGFLAQAENVSVAGGATLSVEGSFLIVPTASSALIAGLLDSGFNPDGAYSLDWSVTTAALYSAPLANHNFAPGIPEASTWAMMLLGFAGLGLAGFRRSRRPAPKA